MRVAAEERSEVGLDGVVVGLTVIVMLAYTMRQDCGRIAEVGWERTTVSLLLCQMGVTFCSPGMV